jgi:hypothetical protein
MPHKDYTIVLLTQKYNDYKEYLWNKKNNHYILATSWRKNKKLLLVHLPQNTIIRI